MKIVLGSDYFSLREAELVSKGTKISISEDQIDKIDQARKLVKELAKKSTLYGINTGFGFLAGKKIDQEKLLELQVNLLRSHASGFGNPLSEAETRLAMILRLNVLIKGNSGVRYELCDRLCSLINHEIIPVIPEYGSVGASGDLAPLAHLVLPLLGEGSVFYKGSIVPANKALSAEGIEPIKLVEKEGLCLINGTQVMTAIGGLALVKALKLLEWSDKITALTFEGLQGTPDCLDPAIHHARGHAGQIESAKNILSCLKGSYLFKNGLKRKRLQDPYSLRCAPQVHGASRDAVAFAKGIIEQEMNAVTDNPLVFTDEGKILSGGNFHGQYLAIALDTAAMAISEISNISERRLEQLLNPYCSGLPAFLTAQEGINSGYMASQYLSASLVNENKLLANPACTDSIPGNVGIEDHVSMGMTSARKFKKIVDHTKVVLAIEWLAACQAVDLRKVNQLGQETKKMYDLLREKVPILSDDRIIAEDVKQAEALLETLL